MPLTNQPFSATAAALATVLLLVACGGDKPETLLASARDYMAKNDHKAAVIQVKNALQKQPDSAEGRFLLGSALLGSGDVAAAEIELRKARDLKFPDDQVVPKLVQAMMLQGKSKKVIEDFAGTKLSVPAAVAELQTALAGAYAADGKQEAAQRALETALAADPNNSAATMLQIRQKLAARNVEAAVAQLDALLARDPKNPEAWRLQGDMLLYIKNAQDEALVAYRKAVEVGPTLVSGHFGALNVLMRQSKLDDADKQMAALKKIAPNHPETRYLETQIAFARKDFTKARELAQQLLRMTPNNPRSLEIAGGIELQLNSLLTAEEHLSKAVQAAPGLPLARRWLAMTYMRSGQLPKAVAILNPVLTDKSTDASLLSLGGEANLLSGDLKKAEEYFARASKLAPQDARTRTALAVTQMAGGKAEPALEELQSIAASDKGTSADLALISTQLRRREFAMALKAIDGLEKKTPTSPVAAHLRGQTQLAMRNPAAARKSFEAALSVTPNYFPAVASLAAMDLADRKPAEARKRFEDVVAREPKNVRAILALAEIRAREPNSKQEVMDLLNRAVAADPADIRARVLLVDYQLQQREIKQAVASAQAALAANPDKPELLDAAGRAQLAAGETNQALTTLAKVVSLQPRSPLPLLRLSDAQVAAKNVGAAEQSLRKALDLQPALLDAQQRLMAIRVSQNRLDDAVAMARGVQKQRPAESVGYLMEGDLRMSQKDYGAAVTAYQAGLKAAPSPDFVIRAHRALVQAGKPAEAERQVSNWLQSRPKDAMVPLYLGDIALSEKNLPQAEKLYAQIVKLQPDNAVAYNNLAWVTSELKKDGAVAYAEKANELVPNQPAFLDTLAMLLADKKEFKKAIELQTRVVGMQDNPLFKLNMARIYAKAGEKEQARKQLDELAKLGDKFGGQAEVEKLRAAL